MLRGLQLHLSSVSGDQTSHLRKDSSAINTIDTIQYQRLAQGGAVGCSVDCATADEEVNVKRVNFTELENALECQI